MDPISPRTTGHEIEPELLGSTPRRVDGDLGNRWHVKALGAYLLLMGAVAVYLTFSALRETTLLVLGTSAEGEAISRRLDPHRGEDGKGSTLVTNAYRDGSRRFVRTERLPGDRTQAFRSGFQVVYLRWAPGLVSMAVPRGESLWHNVHPNWIYALFWNGILAPCVWLFWIIPLRRLRLVSNGRPVIGTIRSLRESSDPNGSAGGIVEYEFVPDDSDKSDARLITGSAAVGEDELEAVRPGDQITILYDPARPERSVPYRFSGFDVPR